MNYYNCIYYTSLDGVIPEGKKEYCYKSEKELETGSIAAVESSRGGTSFVTIIGDGVIPIDMNEDDVKSILGTVEMKLF